MKHLTFLSLLLCSFFWGCSDVPVDTIAQYKDRFLTRNGLLAMMPQDYSPADSADIAQQMVQNWIETEWWKDQTSEMDLTEENEKQLEEYKQTLLFQNWKNQFIAEKLDTVISPEQIIEWRTQLGDSLNKYTNQQIVEVILQSRKNKIISDYKKQSITEAEKSGTIKKGAGLK
jgi:hypothetical protein